MVRRKTAPPNNTLLFSPDRIQDRIIKTQLGSASASPSAPGAGGGGLSTPVSLRLAAKARCPPKRGALSLASGAQSPCCAGFSRRPLPGALRRGGGWSGWERRRQVPGEGAPGGVGARTRQARALCLLLRSCRRSERRRASHHLDPPHLWSVPPRELERLDPARYFPALTADFDLRSVLSPRSRSARLFSLASGGSVLSFPSMFRDPADERFRREMQFCRVPDTPGPMGWDTRERLRPESSSFLACCCLTPLLFS